MGENEIELGPVDYVVVEWPPGKEPTGEGLGLLVDLTERGIIRVIDLAFVMKEEDGTVRGLAITDLDEDGTLDLVQFEGASSGVLGQEDFDERGPRVRHLGRDPRLREQVGGAVRHCSEEKRRATRRQRADPHQRPLGEAR
jgi:hypothetical protein